MSNLLTEAVASQNKWKTSALQLNDLRKQYVRAIETTYDLLMESVIIKDDLINGLLSKQLAVADKAPLDSSLNVQHTENKEMESEQ